MTDFKKLTQQRNIENVTSPRKSKEKTEEPKKRRKQALYLINIENKKKDARLNLLLPHDLKEDMSILAELSGTSTNNLICEILQQIADKNRTAIDKEKNEL